MQYSELMSLDEGGREEVLRTLSEDEIADLWDQKPYLMNGFVAEDGRRYFNNTEELHAYLLRSHVPMTRPWKADEIVHHERAHGECALALGVVGVKYYVLDTMDMETRASVFTHYYGPAELPNLAWAAIAMHPYTASQSRVDVRNIKSYGYASRDQVSQRIINWNEQGNGLYIPEPQQRPARYL